MCLSARTGLGLLGRSPGGEYGVTMWNDCILNPMGRSCCCVSLADPANFLGNAIGKTGVPISVSDALKARRRHDCLMQRILRA